MKKTHHNLRRSYIEKRSAIRQRLGDFKKVITQGSDNQIFEELAFCICTAGASAKMGIKSVDAMRSLLPYGSLKQLQRSLDGVHRFPNARPSYIVHTREYLIAEYDFKIKDLIYSFKDPLERRDFFANNKNIKGIGYKEASHFLRNIGFSGYAILDKHILNTLHEIGIIKDPKPPTTRKGYIEIEDKLKNFADDIGINIDELDLLLWSEKTGEILK